MHKGIRIFAFFFIAVWLLFRHTAGAGFVTDHIGWLYQYEAQGAAGLLRAFDDKSFHFVYHLAGFLLWKLAGFNGEMWMLVFAALHAAVASLGMLVFSQFLKNENVPRAQSIAFFGSLLFLIIPYVTEVLVWYACIHYLLCSFLLLMSFYSMQQYLQRQGKYYLAAFYSTFFVAVFTLEISFSFPMIVAAYVLFAKNSNQRMKTLVLLVAPLLVMLAIYLGLNQYLHGSAIGHYGASTHLNFSLDLLIGNLCKYGAKLFVYTQFLDYDNRHKLYLFAEKTEVVYGVLVVLLLLVSLFVIRIKNLPATFRSAGLLFFFFVVALLPVLNLYFSYLVNIEGDRLSYFASLFSTQLVALVAYTIFRSLAFVPLLGLLFVQKPLLEKNISAWEQSGAVHQSLIAGYRWKDAPRVFVLQLPDNFSGAYMYRDDVQGNVLYTELLLRKMVKPAQCVTQIIAYNMEHNTDSINVEKISESEIKISFAQYGNWWWQKGVGASSFSTDEYEVRIGEWNECFIKFRNHYPGAVYIYQSGTQWREIKNFNNAAAPPVDGKCG
ncbi:MAG: hypothetical protein KA841_03610 [Chitinophagales bacterium]|nr:hypothetical protein [Chitinophagales bacterium]